MLVSSFEEIPITTNVAAGATVTVNFPPGARIYKRLKFTAGAASGDFDDIVENIDLKINGRTVQELLMGTTHGRKIVNGILDVYGNTINNGGQDVTSTNKFVLPLVRNHLRGRPSQGIPDGEAFAFGTSNASTFQADVKIASGVTSPTLACEAEVAAVPGNLGLIESIHTYSFEVAPSTTQEWTTLPRLDPISFVFFHLPADENNISKVTVKINNQVLHELKHDTQFGPGGLLTDKGFGDPRAEGFLIPFNSELFSDSALRIGGINDMRFIVETGSSVSAGQIKITVGTLSRPLG